MRIIAGQFGGQPLKAPRGHRTHPMSEKMRGAIFAMLGDISDLTVLDAFAGSGAVGLEALSRGASKVTFVENNKAALDAIKANITLLSAAQKCSVSGVNIKAWIAHSDQAMDIIVADPPYDDLQVTSLQLLVERLAAEGVLALSWPGGESAPEMPQLKVVAQKNYGDSQLIMYKKNHV